MFIFPSQKHGLYWTASHHCDIWTSLLIFPPSPFYHPSCSVPSPFIPQKYFSLLGTLLICSQYLRESSYLLCKCWVSLLLLHECPPHPHCTESPSNVWLVDHFAPKVSRRAVTGWWRNPEPVSTLYFGNPKARLLYPLPCMKNWRLDSPLALFMTGDFISLLVIFKPYTW